MKLYAETWTHQSNLDVLYKNHSFHSFAHARARVDCAALEHDRVALRLCRPRSHQNRHCDQLHWVDAHLGPCSRQPFIFLKLITVFLISTFRCLLKRAQFPRLSGKAGRVPSRCTYIPSQQSWSAVACIVVRPGWLDTYFCNPHTFFSLFFYMYILDKMSSPRPVVDTADLGTMRTKLAIKEQQYNSPCKQCVLFTTFYFFTIIFRDHIWLLPRFLYSILRWYPFYLKERYSGRKRRRILDFSAVYVSYPLFLVKDFLYVNFFFRWERHLSDGMMI